MMIWLTWRQHRSQAVTAGIALALLAALILFTGIEMRMTYTQLGVGPCAANPGTNPNCNDMIHAFERSYGSLAAALPWLNFLPAVLAILVGAPLVARELESRTNALVWTQSVTRLRWIVTKLAVVLGAAMLLWLILTLLLTWWRGPLDSIEGSFQPQAFDFEGIVPIAYVAFALALAIAAGSVMRRSIPAMFVALVGYLLVRLPVDSWLRPHYMPPLSATFPVSENPPPAVTHGWHVDSGWADHLGHHVSDFTVFGACDPQTLTAKSSMLQCIQAHGYMQYITYQPASRFWAFQGIEAALYLALAVALVAFTIWWVRRRIA